jgi:hypothetical protein
VLEIIKRTLFARIVPRATQTGSDFETKPDGNGVVITKYRGKGGAVTIPDTIDGSPVTAIGKCAFFYVRSSLVSVTIPSNVAAIGKYAFSDCSNLKSVTVPEGVTVIRTGAFSGCSSLASVTIPSSLTVIGKYAFGNCSNLTEIRVLPENQHYKDIDGVLFTKNGKTILAYPAGNARTAYAIPEDITTIGYKTFSCSNLTSVTIPKGVTTIDAMAFCCCKSLVSVIIPEGVTTIGEFTFSGCSCLSSVTIPESVTSIGNGAFLCCNSLEPEVYADIVKL